MDQEYIFRRATSPETTTLHGKDVPLLDLKDSDEFGIMMYRDDERS